jgi:8-amino-7-oxononanoate synthase
MKSFEEALNSELAALREAGLRRELRCVAAPQGPHLVLDGKPILNFSSNDYLGLAGHPALREAAARAAADWGAGSGASRLVCGSLAIHHELEEALAAFKQAEAALTFSSGFATALGVIPAIVGREDILLLDKLAHACCVDGARLSGARLRIFRHNDRADLAAKLKWAETERAAGRARRILIVTESVFSMDGDLAPLRDIADLKDQHGAWLMVDEAHATGLYGEHRRGLIEEFQVADRVEIQMGTLGKALGAAGGYIAGARALIDLLIHRARSFLFSTAPAPAQSAAALASLRIIQGDEGEILRQRCWANVDATKNAVIEAGWPLPPARSAILPLLIGDETRALTVAAALRDQGILVPAIRYPTVARRRARLRLTVTAAHVPADIAKLGLALAAARGEPPATAPA